MSRRCSGGSDSIPLAFSVNTQKGDELGRWDHPVICPFSRKPLHRTHKGHVQRTQHLCDCNKQTVTMATTTTIWNSAPPHLETRFGSGRTPTAWTALDVSLQAGNSSRVSTAVAWAVLRPCLETHLLPIARLSCGRLEGSGVPPPAATGDLWVTPRPCLDLLWSVHSRPSPVWLRRSYNNNNDDNNNDLKNKTVRTRIITVEIFPSRGGATCWPFSGCGGGSGGFGEVGPWGCSGTLTKGFYSSTPQHLKSYLCSFMYSIFF